jgi:hypothetical protein
MPPCSTIWQQQAAQLQQPQQQGAAADSARTPVGGSGPARLAYKVGAGTKDTMFRGPCSRPVWK